MNKVVLGKYVNTHGIKGEIRIKSNFEYKNKVFKVGNQIIINDIFYNIKSYRVHKDYDMVTLDGINDINAIPFSKNTLVYIDRDNYLEEKEYLDSDLIGFIVYNSRLSLEVTGIDYLNYDKKILNCNGRRIPFELIEKVDLQNKKIQVMEVDGLWKLIY